MLAQNVSNDNIDGVRQQGAVDVPTFGMALEGLGAQVGDAMALEVLRPSEGLPTALLLTGEASVVVVLPG